MSVSQQNPITSHTANGVTTVFAFNFYADKESDLVVVVGGVQKALNIDYTVTGAGIEAGGSVNMTTPPALDVVVTIYRDTALERLADYQTAGDLSADNLNRDLDRIWLALQEALGGGVGLNTAIRVPSGETVAALPVAATRANKYLYFGSTGLPTLADGTGGVVSSDEFISVSEFGAVGDGVTDDTAALQLAANSRLNLDFGNTSKNYMVAGTVTLRSGATLRGNGARVTQTSLQRPIFNAVSKDRVCITGLDLYGRAMSVVSAGAMVNGVQYSIVTVGTSTFTSVGAASNTAGVPFTATGPTSGTGTVSTFFNTPNSQDIAIKADRATNLVVAFCKFNNFAYSALMVSLWGENIKFLHNIVNGPGAATLNPLSLSDPQNPGFRNCTGATILGYGIEVHGNVIKDTSQGLIIGQQSTDVLVSGNTVQNTIVEHGMYCDTACRRVRVVENSFRNTKLIGAKVQYYDVTLAATALIAGGLYVIASIGSTDYTLIGAASNTVGLEFKATAAGTGTGTCRLPTPSDIILANNNVDTTGGDGLLVINAGPADIATVTGVTQANPGVFTTAAAHGLAVGDLIDVGGVLGMTPVNSSFRVSTVPTGTTFRVRTPAGELDTSAFPAYTSGGTVKRPVYARSVIIANNTLRNIGQDAISARYVDGLTIEGNTVDTGGRVGIYQLIGLNANTNGNIVRDVQQNGVYVYSPIDLCSVYDNTLVNCGAAGNDAAGASSGIFVEGDGGGTVQGNIVQGEITRTKMLYGIQLGSGNKNLWSIVDNEVYDAESAIVAIHGLDSKSLRQFGGNVGTAAPGPDALSGLATAVPSRGNPRPDWWGSAAPTSGFWAQGSKVWKILPAAGDPLGWINTSSGTPGTWQPFGKVHNTSATQVLAGTYTPTLTNASNTSVLTAQLCMWRIDGDRVTVSGRVNIQPTSNGSLTRFNMSLPVASDLTTSSFATLFGVFASASNQMAGAIYNPGSGAQQNTAQFDCNASTTSQVFIMFQFEYILK